MITPETWITLVASDVYQNDSAELMSIVSWKRTDDRGKFVQDVTAQITDAYRSGGRTLGPAGTIPSNLKDRAVAIALWRFITTGVNKNPGIHTEAREKAFTEATAYLDKIAKREITGIGGVSVVSRERREFTRHKLKGL